MTSFEPDDLLQELHEMHRTLIAILVVLVVSFFATGCDSPDTLVGPTAEFRQCPVGRCTFGADVYCYDGIGYRLCSAG